MFNIQARYVSPKWQQGFIEKQINQLKGTIRKQRMMRPVHPNPNPNTRYYTFNHNIQSRTYFKNYSASLLNTDKN